VDLYKAWGKDELLREWTGKAEALKAPAPTSK
jgi:hypothetical protein